MITDEEKSFLERAIELSRRGMEKDYGGPFGCVVVKNGEIVGEGCNMVTSTNDPTAHAEIVAIRAACSKLNTYQLDQCDIYTSCEPCPMCLGAIYWARPRRIVYANTRHDAAAVSFDDEFIYKEIGASMLQRHLAFIHEPHPMALQVFKEWAEKPDKKIY